MATLKDITSAKNIVDYYNSTAPARDAFFGEKLFPAIKQSGTRIDWIKGYKKRDIVLQPSALDVKASLRTHSDIEKIEKEAPIFREGMNLTEEDKRRINDILLRENANLSERLIIKYFEERAGLVMGARAQAERMAMFAMMYSKFNLVPSKAQGRTNAHAVDYDASGEWKAKNLVTLAGTNTWTQANAATADPIKDILDGVAKHKEQGTVTSTILMNSATFNALISAESTAKRVAPLNSYLNRKDAEKYVNENADAAIYKYDRTIVDEEGVEAKLLHDGFVILLPAQPVGEMVYCETPEEYEFLGAGRRAAQEDPTSLVDIAIADPGIAVLTQRQAHPVLTTTIVSAQVLPSFEGMEQVYTMKVF